MSNVTDSMLSVIDLMFTINNSMISVIDFIFNILMILLAFMNSLELILFKVVRIWKLKIEMEITSHYRKSRKTRLLKGERVVEVQEILLVFFRNVDSLYIHRPWYYVHCPWYYVQFIDLDTIFIVFEVHYHWQYVQFIDLNTMFTIFEVHYCWYYV